MTPKEHKAIMAATKWIQDNTHPGKLFIEVDAGSVKDNTVKTLDGQKLNIICPSCKGQGGDTENGPYCRICDGTGEMLV